MMDPVELWLAHVIEVLRTYITDPKLGEKARCAIAALEEILHEPA